jgi:hypothetical protein
MRKALDRNPGLPLYQSETELISLSYRVTFVINYWAAICSHNFSACNNNSCFARSVNLFLNLSRDRNDLISGRINCIR